MKAFGWPPGRHERGDSREIQPCLSRIDVPHEKVFEILVPGSIDAAFEVTNVPLTASKIDRLFCALVRTGESSTLPTL